MIIEDQKINEVYGVEQEDTVQMTIDDSAKKKLMMVLSQNLYQDPIGSIIREYTSNALDAQKEIGNTEPIRVRLIKQNDQFVFIVEDNGIGLSPERVENVFSKYLSSTKENDKNQLGYYGLGSKSALSYVDSFMIHSRYDGKIYSYLMLKGEKGTELSLLDINDCDDRNGVTIVITLKEEEDYEIFLEKIKTQLPYFESVYIETYYDDIENDFKIVKTEDWKYSELNTDPYMHLSLDNVYYPLDFNKLGIEPIKIPIGITFSLNDGIVPTPSREGFLYTPQVKSLILEKIKKVGNEFIDKWNNIAPAAKDLNEAHRLHDHWGVINLYKEEENGIVLKNINIKIDKTIEKICENKMKSVVLSLFPNLDVENLHKNLIHLLQDYKVFSEYSGYTFKSRIEGESGYRDLLPSSLYQPVYLFEPGEVITKQQLGYLKWLGKPFLIARKHSHTKLGHYDRYGSYGRNTYRFLLNLDKKPKEKWRQLIQEYQDLVKTYTDQLIPSSTIVPTQEYFDWKESQKKARKPRSVKSKEDITYSTIRKASRSNAKSKYLVNQSFTIPMNTLSKQKGLFIYCGDQDEQIPKELYELFSYKKENIQLVMLSERNYNKLQKLGKIHNWIKAEDFWNTKNKYFSKYLTIDLLDRVLSNINSPSFVDQTILVEIKTKSKQQKLVKTLNWVDGRYISDEFLLEKIRLYHKNNWLDQTLINKFIEIYTDIHKFDFLSVFNIYYNDKKQLKKFATTLYLDQIQKSKKSGNLWYEQLDIKSEINKVIEGTKTIQQILDEEDELEKEEIEEVEDITIEC